MTDETTEYNERFRFQGQGEFQTTAREGRPAWQSLQRLDLERIDDPAHYHTEDEGLHAAVNTALALGMPLLVTGPPGVGKTQLAYRIAYELGCGTLSFAVKSTSEAQDLFYYIDHLRRWRDAQLQESVDGRDAQQDAVDIRRFIRFQGLGLAILRAMPEEVLARLGLRDLAWPPTDEHLPDFRQRQPSVVLIDEIDKAPTDFPNDLLEEIRRLSFQVPELGRQPLSLYRDPERPDREELRYRPVVVITSNSEKVLPEPFLRRCVYYHIAPPDKAALERIIAGRVAERSRLTPAVQARSLDFFLYLRDAATLDKPPSTAELLSWLLALAEQRPALTEADCDAGSGPWRRLAGHCLLKLESDQRRINDLVDQWLSRSRRR